MCTALAGPDRAGRDGRPIMICGTTDEKNLEDRGTSVRGEIRGLGKPVGWTRIQSLNVQTGRQDNRLSRCFNRRWDLRG